MWVLLFLLFNIIHGFMNKTTALTNCLTYWQIFHCIKTKFRYKFQTFIQISEEQPN